MSRQQEVAQSVDRLHDITDFIAGVTNLKKLRYLESRSVKVRHQMLDNAQMRMEHLFRGDYWSYHEMIKLAHELADLIPEPFTSLARRSRQNRNRKFFNHPPALRQGRRIRRRVPGRAAA